LLQHCSHCPAAQDQARSWKKNAVGILPPSAHNPCCASPHNMPVLLHTRRVQRRAAAASFLCCTTSLASPAPMRTSHKREARRRPAPNTASPSLHQTPHPGDSPISVAVVSKCAAAISGSSSSRDRRHRQPAQAGTPAEAGNKNTYRCSLSAHTGSLLARCCIVCCLVLCATLCHAVPCLDTQGPECGG
jgi:hypothetical protein